MGECPGFDCCVVRDVHSGRVSRPKLCSKPVMFVTSRGATSHCISSMGRVAMFSGYSRMHLFHGRRLVKGRVHGRHAPLCHSVMRGNKDPYCIFGTNACRTNRLITRKVMSKGIITARDMHAPRRPQRIGV